MTLEAGTRLGRYRIESLVGRGGMGAVYLATDTQLERRVALKVLSPELTEDARFRERFIAESRIAASLDHPNIVPLYEAGDIDGHLFIAMRYIDGHDLAEVLAARGALPIALAVRIVAAIAAALDAAHAKGLVHRDVKPGNVLLTGSDEAPHVYLTDFGLTKRLGDASMSAAGQIVGSIGYVAPEQVEGRPVDARTDVYSLGCLAYEVLAGGQPFRRDSEMAVLMAHVQDPPPSLLTRRPELPEAVDAAVARAMAKDPSARFDSAGAFAAALGEAVRPDSAATTRGFLFSDLRGYTAFVERHGDAKASALLDVYRRMMRDTIARHGGAEIKTEGDSFYVVFPSASSAVICGLSVVAAAAAHSQADPEHPINVGIGVNAGEAVAAAEGYVGSAVNIAARVCAQAKAGEVLVTDTVRGLTRTSGRLTFTPVGRRALKGIAEPMLLFHADLAGTGPLVAPRPSRPIWRRPPVLAGSGAVVALALALAVAAGRLPFATGVSPSIRATVKASLPPPPAPIERIAYAAHPLYRATEVPTCDSFEESRIRLVAPGGGDGTRVMEPADLWEAQPAWSPDGTQLAFVGQTDTASLYVVNANGTGLRNLIPTLPAGVEAAPDAMPGPAWSPDGQRLLFTYGTNGVWLVGADGSDLHRLIAPLPAPVATPDQKGDVPMTFGPSFRAATWMPDGRIAIPVTDQSKDDPNAHTILYAAAADGTGLAPLPGMPSGVDIDQPTWSADGRLAYVSYAPGASPEDPQVGNLFLLDPGSATPQMVPGTSGIVGRPAWSPDGSRLAFAAAGHLYTIRADGTDRQEVTVDPGFAACSADWGRTTDVALANPAGTQNPAASPGPRPFHRGGLDPGTYVTDVFAPRMQFNVGGGWVALINYVDGLALGRPEYSVEEEIDAGRVQVVFDSPCRSGVTRTIGPTAREFFDWVQHNAFLTAGNPRPVVIGGRTGLAIDVVVSRTPTVKNCPDEQDPFLNRVWLFQIGETSYWFRAKQHVRIVSIDVGQGPAVTFIYGGDPASADAFIEQAQGIIDSLTFPAAP